MKYLKKFNEGSDIETSERYLVDNFIDHLFNHNDTFFTIGDGKYEYDSKGGRILINLDRYGDEKEYFIKEVESLINSDKKLLNNYRAGDLTFVGIENNNLVLSVR